MCLTAQILRIEKSSIHDGTGLRTVVFFKGCPLRCQWCSTPESQSSRIQMGHDAERCQDCGLCVRHCPLHLDPRIRPNTCQTCGRCQMYCPTHANIRYGKNFTLDQVLEEILKDEVFYFHSGGGVTLSGGEPLTQSDFAYALLRQVRSLGISTAVETSFYGPWERIVQLLPYTDQLFVDIKHMDCQSHRQYCGVENTLILANICRAAESSANFALTLRTPVVPGYNDSRENLEATARFCVALPRPARLELLPYHRLGVSSYRKLGLDYPLLYVQPPTAAQMALYRSWVEPILAEKQAC